MVAGRKMSETIVLDRLRRPEKRKPRRGWGGVSDAAMQCVYLAALSLSFVVSALALSFVLSFAALSAFAFSFAALASAAFLAFSSLAFSFAALTSSALLILALESSLAAAPDAGGTAGAGAGVAAGDGAARVAAGAGVFAGSGLAGADGAAAAVAPETAICSLIFANSPSLMPLTFMMSSGVLNGPFALR